ncbi:MAG: hypothetical protein ACOYI5_06430 [Christensenellales bacterium]
MRKYSFLIAMVMAISCLMVSANADGEIRNYDMLSTYGVEPSIAVTFESIGYDLVNSISRDELVSALGSPFYSFRNDTVESIEYLVYISDMEELKTELVYAFEENIIQDVSFSPIPTEGTATMENYYQNSVMMYHHYFDLFTRELGEPQTIGEIWHNDAYQDIPEMRDHAFEQGHFIYEMVMWESDHVICLNIIFGDSTIQFLAGPSSNKF